MGRLKLVIVLFAISAIILTGLYLVCKSMLRAEQKKTDAFSNGFKYSKGVIVNIHYYKRQTLVIRYTIANKDYTYGGGWDKNRNPHRLSAGDSIAFKYATSDPNYVITELERDY